MAHSFASKIAIAGFGREGQALAAYFAGKTTIHVFDERPVTVPAYVSSVTQNLRIPSDIPVVYKTPGIPTREVTVAPGVRIESLMNVYLDEVQGTVVGVTGTKGKSTVSALIHHVLAQAGKDTVLVGNIGTSALAALEGDSRDRIHVVEMSSYQCEHLRHSPHIAVLINLYQEHLSHHGSFEEYRNAKYNIARHQTQDGVFINASKEEVAFRGKVHAPVADMQFDTKLRGTHNQQNCAVAYTVLTVLGIDDQTIRNAFSSFEPLPHRLSCIGTHHGISFYDATLATIPEAVMACIEALHDVDTIILGGVDRGVDFVAFAQYLASTAIQTFITFPPTGERMVTSVSERTIVPVATMEAAVRAAYTHAKKTVLLAPASSTYDMLTESEFKTYAEKSDAYLQWIKKLAPPNE